MLGIDLSFTGENSLSQQPPRGQYSDCVHFTEQEAKAQHGDLN